MELACQTPTPQTVVIGSGDADFVPLVVRLRERGIKVLCASECRKMAPEAVKAYDGVIYVGRTAVPTAAPPKVPPVVKKVAPKPTPAATATPADQVTKDMVLDAIPKLKTGEWLQISDAAKALHDKKLLSKSASSARLFKRFPQSFELKPEKQPNQVRLTGAAD